MRNKKLFASLLTVALVVGSFPMNASAAGMEENAKVAALRDVKLSPVVATETLVSDQGLATESVSAEEQQKLDDKFAKGTVQADGVQVTEAKEDEITVDVTETREFAEERVEEQYNEDDVVKAFIITEDAALIEQGFDAEEIGTTKSAIKAEDQLEAAQEELISTIETEVLDGKDLDVEYTYQYTVSGISATVTYGQLAEIAKLDGVKTAFVTPQYELDPTEYETDTVASGGMIGKGLAHQNGYTGIGTRISIIDTGIDYDHQSFQALPADKVAEGALAEGEIDSVITELNAYDLMKGKLSASDVYHTTKIAYSFNYVDENLDASHDNDNQGDHGTHVAGIAAADAIDASDVIGVAPDAQLIVCKVFGKNGGAYFDDILAGIEDSIVLKADAINMSLGSPAGFSSEDEAIDEIFARVAEAGIVMSVSAGNNYSSAYGNDFGNNLNLASNPDNGIVGSPSSFSSSTSVASVNSTGTTSLQYVTVDGNVIALIGGSYSLEDGKTYNKTMITEFGGKTVPFVMVNNFGEVEDFQAAGVEGKIAVVSRGSISFADKMANAKKAGAVGLLVYNNTTGTVSMSLATSSIDNCIPTASITQAEGAVLAKAFAAGVTEMTVSDGKKPATVISDATYYTMSDFSSWGVTADLELVPDITAPGGNIYSCYDGGSYGLMSGTSMAAPQIAGVFGLIKQRLKAEYPNVTGRDLYTLTNALIMSTSNPIIAGSTGELDVEYSPRKQGSGLVDINKALASETYLSVPGTDKPNVSLYDDPAKTGVYTFTFDVVNMGDADVTYALHASVLTDSTVSDGKQLFLAEKATPLDDASVVFAENKVTVPAHGTKAVTATITLTDDDKKLMDTYFTNGIYVEGFVYLTTEDKDAVDLSLPYMGFYGDWTKTAMLDAGYWNDEESTPTVHWRNTPFTTFGSRNSVLGANPFIDDCDVYHNVISPNGDKYNDTFDNIYFGLLRNAKDITITYTDKATNEKIHEDVLPFVRKEYYSSSVGLIYPTMYNQYNDTMYDFTDADKNPLADGTVVEMKLVATLDYARHAQNNDSDTWTEEILIDSTAPVLSKAVYTDGKLTLTAEDEGYLAAIIFVSKSNKILDKVDVSTEKAGEAVTKTFDVDGYGQEFYVLLGDYGANEAQYKITCPANTEKTKEYFLAGVTANGDIDKMDLDALEVSPYSDFLEEFAIIGADTDDEGIVYFAENDGEYTYLGYADIDALEGEYMSKMPITYGVRDIAVDTENGCIYAAANVSGATPYLFVIDLKTGKLTANYNLTGFIDDTAAVTVDTEGNVYMMSTTGALICISKYLDITKYGSMNIGLDNEFELSLEYDADKNVFYLGIMDAEAFDKYAVIVFTYWWEIENVINIDEEYTALFMFTSETEVAPTKIASPIGTWVSGSYAQNGKVEQNETRIRLEEALKVEAGKTYEAVVTDPAYRMIVRKVPAEGKVSTFYLSNTDRFTAEEGATYYVCVHNYYNDFEKKYGTKLTFDQYVMLFKNGMSFDLKDVTEAAAAEVTEITNELGTWKSGTYSQTKAAFEANKERIYLEGELAVVAGRQYQANISNDTLRFIVRKVDKNTKAVTSFFLANGETFTAEEGYSYFLTSQNYLGKLKNVTFQTYVDLFANGLVFTVEDVTPAVESVDETEETVEETEETVEETVETVVEETTETVEETVEETVAEVPAE